ncbi:MAG: hypothetical protein WBN08_15755 [Thiogranum sp.]
MCTATPGVRPTGSLALLIGQAQAFGFLPSEFAAEVLELDHRFELFGKGCHQAVDVLGGFVAGYDPGSVLLPYGHRCRSLYDVTMQDSTANP